MSSNIQPNDQSQEQESTESGVVKAAKPVKKSPGAFRTISEVAKELKVQQHVLRFWETKFSQVKPLKRGGGRRYYRPEDIALLKKIHHLLYTEGYTIKGVQKLFKGQSKNQIAAGELAESSNVEVEQAAPAMPAVNPTEAMTQPVKIERQEQEKMNPKQRAILESMLGELKELRDMVRNSEKGDS